MTAIEDPRQHICNLILNDEREKLLERAGEIHGHFCPFLGVGVNASITGLTKLDVVTSTGMEEIMAVVECNNCFVDGIQAISGCTFGNNALIYKDLGKNAVTFYRRDGSRGCRLSVRKDNVLRHETDQDERDANELFDKKVKRRETLAEAENDRFRELWSNLSYKAVRLPTEEAFNIDDVDAPEIPYAPMLASVTCAVCGELVMESRATFINEQPACRSCAGQEYWMVAGRGIHPVCGS